MIKSCIKNKISPDKGSDYMENYKPFISGVVPLVGDESSESENFERYWSNSVPHVRQCTTPYRK